MCFAPKIPAPPKPPEPPTPPPPPSPTAMSVQPAPTSPEAAGIGEYSRMSSIKRGKKSLVIPMSVSGGSGLNP